MLTHKNIGVFRVKIYTKTKCICTKRRRAKLRFATPTGAQRMVLFPVVCFTKPPFGLFPFSPKGKLEKQQKVKNKLQRTNNETTKVLQQAKCCLMQTPCFCKSSARTTSFLHHRRFASTHCTYNFASPLYAIPESTSESTYTKRSAFYQAGKCLIQTLVFDHPKISLLNLKELTNNAVFSLQGLPSIESRKDLETFLIGCYGGKAGELFNAYREVVSSHPLPLLKKDEVIVLRQRKDLVYVNGLFANASTFRAKRSYKRKTKWSQIRYTCDTFCAVSRKQIYKSQAGDLVLTGEPFVKREGNVNVQKPENDQPLFKVKTKLLSQNRGWLKSDVVERSTQVSSLESVLLREHSLAASLSHFSFVKRLNCAKMKQFLCQSDTGLLERIKATFVVQSIIVNGSISSPTFFNLKKNSIVGNLNKTEIKDKKMIYLFQSLEEQIKNVYFEKDISNRSFGSNNSFLTDSYKKEFVTKQKIVTQPSGAQSFQSAESHTDDISAYNNSALASPTNTLLFSKRTNVISQKQESSALCEEIVCKSLTFSIKPYGHWFRIYLPQIETHQRQPVSADHFFKKRRELGFLKYTNVNWLQIGFATNCKDFVLSEKANVSIALPSISYASSKVSFFQVSQTLESKVQAELSPTFNMLAQTFGDVWPQELGYGLCHYLVLNMFSRAFHLIGKNREFLDVLADHLIRFEKIRMPEISRISSFYVKKPNLSSIESDKSSAIVASR